jgi:hypothetical protein
LNLILLVTGSNKFYSYDLSWIFFFGSVEYKTQLFASRLHSFSRKVFLLVKKDKT